MVRYDEDEDLGYESFGRIPRRGDDSRSPPRGDRRERSDSDDRRLTNSSSDRSRQSSRSHDRERPWGQHATTDAGAALRAEPRDKDAAIPTVTISTGRSPISEYFNKATNGHVGKASTNGHATESRALRVKEPSDDDDLTKEEFEKYQARYGLRRKISMSQILEGTSDEDAEDPTLGNRRTQTSLSEDGTIERRDFDTEGGFEYAPLGKTGISKMRERRVRSIEQLSLDD